MGIFNEIGDALDRLSDVAMGALKRKPAKQATHSARQSSNRSGSATIRINDAIYSGSVVSIINNKVIVNGKEVTIDPDHREIHIEIEGNVDSLDVDCCEQVVVHGNANRVSTVSGSVKCGDVDGNVTSVSGSIHAGAIRGSVSTISGSIKR